MSEKNEIQNRHEEHEKREPSPPVSDPIRTKRLVRAADLRLMPLLAWIYLLNYLGLHSHYDHSYKTNIGQIVGTLEMLVY